MVKYSSSVLLHLVNLPEKRRASIPAFNALSETNVSTVKITGRITAFLNTKANNSGIAIFFNLPDRGSVKETRKAVR